MCGWRIGIFLCSVGFCYFCVVCCVVSVVWMFYYGFCLVNILFYLLVCSVFSLCCVWICWIVVIRKLMKVVIVGGSLCLVMVWICRVCWCSLFLVIGIRVMVFFLVCFCMVRKLFSVIVFGEWVVKW